MAPGPESRGFAIFVVILLGGALFVPGVFGASPESTGSPTQSRPAAADPAVVMTLQLSSNGSARWNVTARFLIRDANESAAFDRLAEAFESGNATPGFSLATFEALADVASNRTDREMEITDPIRRATRTGAETNGTGRLTLLFTWENFAATEGNRIVVGDVFESWRLEDGQRLVIYPPEGYGLQSVTPGTDGIRRGGPLWNGPEAFGAGEPSVTYKLGLTPSPTATTSKGPVDRSLPIVPALLGIGVIVVVALGLWLYFGESPAGTMAPEPESGPAGGDADSGHATGSSDSEGGTPDAAGDAVDPELLSDEERVEYLLEQHDGRMRQADIVSETGWSNAKVSQLLSQMAEEGRIEKLRMGRENLISLEGEFEE